MPKTRTLNDNTFASDPGQVKISHKKLRLLRPDLYGIGGSFKALLGSLKLAFPERVYLSEQLQHGDSRAAVCVSIKPLLIAAYTDELDCVAMLRFPEFLVEQYSLAVGTRLLTVNCYGSGGQISSDLIVGPKQLRRWVRFHPIIANFISDDTGRVEERMAGIDEAEWEYAMRLGTEYLRVRPGLARDGRPGFSKKPAKQWNQ